MRSGFRMAALWVGLAAVVAHAEADTFGLGDGHDGNPSFYFDQELPQPRALLVQGVAAGDTVLRLNALPSSPAFAVGDLVLIHCSATYAPLLQGTETDISLATSSTGRWELGRISAINAQQVRLTLSAPLEKAFPAQAQVLHVPEYQSVSIMSGVRLSAPPWDGSTGGILAFLATGTITNNGVLSAAGAGFRGGSGVRSVSAPGAISLVEPSPDAGYKGESVGNALDARSGYGNWANGGGGGNGENAGGGGGGNGGPGGKGGRTWGGDGSRDVGGRGGAKLSGSLPEWLTFGGGGGAGHTNAGASVASSGAPGGGIVFIRANALAGTGLVTADGLSGVDVINDGTGGGGGGGTIYLRVSGSAAAAQVRANGGDGGSVVDLPSVGPGGGGGGGRLFVQALGTLPPLSVEPGIAGTQHNNAGACFNSYPEASFEGNGCYYGAEPMPSSAPGYAGPTPSVATNGFVAALQTPTLTSPAPGAWLSSRSVTAAGQNPAGRDVALYVDGALDRVLVVPGSFWSLVVTFGSDGAHTIAAAADDYGARSLPSSVTVNVDTVAPAKPTVTFPTPGALLAAAPIFLGSTEALALVRLRIGTSDAGLALADQQTATTGSFALDAGPLPLGTYLGEVVALDRAGNPSLATVVSFAIVDAGPVDAGQDGGATPDSGAPDAGPDAGQDGGPDSGTEDGGGGGEILGTDTESPDTAINAGPMAAVLRGVARFEFEATEASVFECSLDGAPFEACVPPTLYEELSEGAHRFEVRAIDMAGNVDPTPAEWGWQVKLSAEKFGVGCGCATDGTGQGSAGLAVFALLWVVRRRRPG